MTAKTRWDYQRQDTLEDILNQPYHEFFFTHDVRDRLTAILGDGENILELISALEGVAERYLNYNIEYEKEQKNRLDGYVYTIRKTEPTIPENIETLKDLNHHIEKLKKKLLLIEKHPIGIDLSFVQNSDNNQSQVAAPSIEALTQLSELSKKAINELTAVTKSGKKRNPITWEFFADVAALWSYKLGKMPVSTECGSYHQTMNILFEVCNIQFPADCKQYLLFGIKRAKCVKASLI